MKALPARWIAFQGTIDKACSHDSVAAFVKATGNAEEAVLPKVGHGFSVEKNWVPQFRRAFASIAGKGAAAGPKMAPAEKNDVEGLPLVEVPAVNASRNEFAVLLSGDGGWAGIDRSIAGALSAAGVPVVGWNSLQYYWTPRTPEQASADLGRII